MDSTECDAMLEEPLLLLALDRCIWFSRSRCCGFLSDQIQLRLFRTIQLCTATDFAARITKRRRICDTFMRREDTNDEMMSDEEGPEV